ncbi:MAG TPA: alpha/beta fold hydrolase [Nevskiaceae bacterium]|nr:alpha/beta fold hydrolase [Nevskiaceae bacterium]
MRRAAPVLASLLLAGLAACSNPPYPRGTVEALYPQPPRPVLRQLAVDGRRLQLAEMAGRSGAAPLVFVHGSPGDWQAWSRYLSDPALATYGPRYAFDRPGFGGSEPGAVITDLRVQARLLMQALDQLGGPAPRPPAVLVGHSLGGPLVAWMALDRPEAVCAAVMIAGSVSARREAPRWYNRLADTALARALLPAELVWSNREMLALQPELQRLEAALPALQRPLWALQGGRDELVDPRTVSDLAARVPASQLQVRRYPEAGHFLLWDQPAAVSAVLRELPCATPPSPQGRRV